jgi:6-phosphofructokinase 1
MNAALRTVAIAGLARGHSVVGIQNGYRGLLAAQTMPLTADKVDGISRFGGTILGSARSDEFRSEAGQKKAQQRISDMGLDALIIIGGNGSLAGAHALAAERPCTIVGLPASIDNDIGHSNMSIGVDTAVNTIVEACDRISDTARAHRRAFIVEVMGRQCGFLAMRAGIAAEADAIVYREDGQRNEDDLVLELSQVLGSCFGRQKTRALIIKSEGVTVSSAKLASRLQAWLDENYPGVKLRQTVLGHVVRGGNPSALDRVIAQRLGFAAVLACEEGEHDVMLGWDSASTVGESTLDRYIRKVPIADALKETQCLLDGSSKLLQRRLALLNQVKSILAF